MNKKFNIKFPRTSKLIMWVFIILFIYVIFNAVNYDFTNISYMDACIFATAITATAGITGAIVKSYLNNSNAENIPTIQLKLFKEATDVRLLYNEQMMKLKNKYELNDDTVNEIENSFCMDEVSEGILNKTISELDIKSDQSHEDIDV